MQTFLGLQQAGAFLLLWNICLKYIYLSLSISFYILYLDIHYT